MTAARIGGARPTPPIPDHGAGPAGWDAVALGDTSSHSRRREYQNQGGMGEGSHPVPSNSMQSRSGQVMVADPEESCGWSPSTEVTY
jgi:hypothetical protein